MPRLPQPGGDDNTWGDILNQYLLSGHKSDGTHDVKGLLGVPSTSGKVPVTDGTSNGFSWQDPPSSPNSVDNSAVGAPNGVASLDGSGVIPVSQIPATFVQTTDGLTIPSGGTTGQILVKNSDNDYDVSWVDASSVGVGGGGGATLIAQAPYPTGGVVGAGESGCWLTYTDPITGYVWRIHRFVHGGVAGDLPVLDNLVVTHGVIGELLVVGGGGGGGYPNGQTGGGGGAGTLYENQYAFGVGTHLASVGSGGIQATRGGDTRFDDIICYGGGAGGNGITDNTADRTGGSAGGGGGRHPFAGGGRFSGVSAIGGSLDAGNTTLKTTPFRAFDSDGSGVGAGAGGSNGAGRTSSISGAPVTYASGASWGGFNAQAPSGANDTGSSGAGGDYFGNPGVGGSGIVIARYRIA